MKTTLCYIERDDKYLMLFRNKKENDPAEGKYVGIGGKFMEGETPEECLRREVMEETGLVLTDFQHRGIVYFISDTWDNEDMYLYTATGFTLPDGTVPEPDYLPDCSEGTLEWVPIQDVESLNLWEGDRYFLRALAAGETGIDMTFWYEGDTLVKTRL